MFNIKKKYFVSYFLTTKLKGFTFGNCNYNTKSSLDTPEGRDEFIKEVLKENKDLSGCVIINYKRILF